MPAFGIYVHVPFCAVRCGYCDFNTYTAVELGGGGAQAAFADVACSEVDRMAAAVGQRTVDTVFFGGGTPTLLPAPDLGRVLRRVRSLLPLAADAEVTTEANPESVDAGALAALREAGFTRVSFGMQSAVPHVLAVLDRTHRPDRVPAVVSWARAAGFEHVSLDLIYGTPGESADDWGRTLDAALSTEPDHVSAYSLIVEEGTALGRRVAVGELPAPDDDDLADKYLQADERLAAAGLHWYEVSNWARDEQQRCRHNLGYWRSDDWWGIGPGAHSHLSGHRWWNVKHPSAYAGRLAVGESPAAGEEEVEAADRHVEHVMLRTRLAEGLPLALLDGGQRVELERLCSDGLLGVDRPTTGRAQLTVRGRLLADLVVRRLIAAGGPEPAAGAAT